MGENPGEDGSDWLIERFGALLMSERSELAKDIVPAFLSTGGYRLQAALEDVGDGRPVVESVRRVLCGGEMEE